MAHYTITIPEDVDKKLNQEAAKRNENTATYITELLGSGCDERNEHMEETIERQHSLIDKLEDDLKGIQEQLKREQETLERVEELEQSLKTAEGSLAEATERNRSLMEELQESEASRENTRNELQHRIDLLEKDRTNTRALLQEARGHVQELRADKVNLQEQIELLTSRLPKPAPPKRGWRERLLGSKREEQQSDTPSHEAPAASRLRLWKRS
ncbi:MAG: hypothetical protein ACXVJJ_06265 [Halobacteriota archaeon]